MQENFVIPIICIKPPLMAYLERNGIFNFDKMVLGYVKTVMDSTALSILAVGTISVDMEPPLAMFKRC